MLDLIQVKPSPSDERDFIAKLPYIDIIKESVDLKPFSEEVENQFSFNSCTANAGCSALELMYKQKDMFFDFSRLYLYYYTRQLSGIRGDNGAYPRDIGKALKTYGVCFENDWEYELDNIESEPSDDLKSKASTYIIDSYEQLVGDRLQQIQNALSQGIPILLTMRVHQDFYNINNNMNWKTHTWDASDASDNYHEVLVIGYDNESKRLLVENSWGSQWADGGFFGIPYDIIDQVVTELWILNPNYNIPYNKPLNQIKKLKTAIQNNFPILLIAATVIMTIFAI